MTPHVRTLRANAKQNLHTKDCDLSDGLALTLVRKDIELRFLLEWLEPQSGE